VDAALGAGVGAGAAVAVDPLADDEALKLGVAPVDRLAGHQSADVALAQAVETLQRVAFAVRERLFDHVMSLLR
jgi:hypothetical protein